MMQIHLTHTIDAGHRIVGHEGKCARLHGHTYKFEVWLKSYATDLVDPGFVVDFGHVKQILDHWDHKMLLWEEDPIHVRDRQGLLHDAEMGVLRVPFNPTAENMAKYLQKLFIDAFPNIYMAKVRVWETPKAYAEFG